VSHREPPGGAAGRQLVITPAQAKSWHPCRRGPGQAYSDARLEELFGGEPATWERVASWDIERGDVIWLATRPGALPERGRRLLVDRVVKESDSGLCKDCAYESIYSDVRGERAAERAAEELARYRAWRSVGDLGWAEVHLANARAALAAGRAAGIEAAAWAWEASQVADACACSWERQVVILLAVVKGDER